MLRSPFYAKGGEAIPSLAIPALTSRCSSLLPAVPADARSADNVIAFGRPAMINLGLMYVSGEGGLPQDMEKAGEWFGRAHPASDFIK